MHLLLTVHISLVKHSQNVTNWLIITNVSVMFKTDSCWGLRKETQLFYTHSIVPKVRAKLIFETASQNTVTRKQYPLGHHIKQQGLHTVHAHLTSETKMAKHDGP